MPALHNRDRETSDYRDQKDDGREISLGTGTILAIFFALALICAVFFGLGYSMGRKSAQASIQTPASAASDSAASSTFSSFKPPAGSPATQSAAAKKSPGTASPADPDAEIVTTPVSSPQDNSEVRPAAASRKETASETAAAPIVREAPHSQSPSPSQGSPQSQSSSGAMPAIDPNGTAMVQVAAVSHQEDAETLIASLKKRGYTVFIRQEPQDKLFHVQTGPFATKKDADAMRLRLLADGYIAIVK
jgi:cell division septation protein DedD